MKRRTILLMAIIGAALLLAGGVALAENVTCDSTPPCYGTPEADINITGTDAGETIYALGGADRVFGTQGSDTIYGGGGNDETLAGEEGDDSVYGGKGNDAIRAEISDSSGSTDHSYGGGGNDTIHAEDIDGLDIIDCGKGADMVFYDSGLDKFKNCENKQPF